MNGEARAGDAAAPRSRGLLARLFEPVDLASLAVFRIVFGGVMAWDAYRMLRSGQVRVELVEPALLVSWPGFELVQRWPEPGLYLHFYALIALGLLIAAGCLFRVSAALFCVGFSYVFLLDQTFYQNHNYLICLISFLLAISPAHRLLSLDAHWRPGLRSETGPAWPLWLLRCQMGIVYFWAGVAKLNPDWLRGYPMRLWVPDMGTLPLVGAVFESPGVAIAMSWSGMLLDLLAFPALLWRRTRIAAVAVLVVFHLWNSRLFDILPFPWIAIATTLLFLDPGWPRRIFRWPRREATPPGLGPPGVGPPGALRQQATVAAVCLWIAVQAASPARQFLYPGDPSWTGEGHLFAWRMMLRQSISVVNFELHDPGGGDRWIVDPADELDARQVRRISRSPLAIHRYARRLARTEREASGREVEVRAHGLVAVNGRVAQALVDPAVDLAAQAPRVLGHAEWILPLDVPLSRQWKPER